MHVTKVRWLAVAAGAALLLAVACQPQTQAPAPEAAPAAAPAAAAKADPGQLKQLETRIALLEHQLLEMKRAVPAPAPAPAAPAAAPAAKVAEVKKEAKRADVRKVEVKKERPAAPVKVAGNMVAPKGINGCPSKGPADARVTIVEFTDFQ